MFENDNNYLLTLKEKRLKLVHCLVWNGSLNGYFETWMNFENYLYEFGSRKLLNLIYST